MFHYRWGDVDQLSAADASPDRCNRAPMRASTPKQRGRSADWSTASGSSAQRDHRAADESSFERAIELLDAHFARILICSAADPRSVTSGCGLNSHCAWTDPTAGALIEGRTQSLLAWIHRMLWPRAEGEFADWSALSYAATAPQYDRRAAVPAVERRKRSRHRERRRTFSSRSTAAPGRKSRRNTTLARWQRCAKYGAAESKS
jgi:hypothetical protein